MSIRSYIDGLQALKTPQKGLGRALSVWGLGFRVWGLGFRV